jgi:hypothetical protein
MTYAEQVELLGQVSAYEAAGQHREAIALCEQVLDGNEIPEFNLALARNYYALALAGNEIHAWPALLAALAGIAKRTEQQPDVVHAIGICRWVLELFADPHRFDTLGFSQGSANLDEAERLLSSGQHVRAVNALLAAAPPIVRHGRDSQWVKREAQYTLASLCASSAGEKSAALLASEEFPPPGDHDGQYYDRYLLTAATVRREQLRARAAGVPGIIITSLPKSASEFLGYTLAEALACPVMRVTVGYPLMGAVQPKWVEAVREGGAVTHDHFPATDANLAALREVGLTQLWVLVRDPRAAFWSYVNMQTEYDGVQPGERLNREFVLLWVKRFGDWVGSWVRAKNSFPVRFVFFQELTKFPEAVMGEVLEASGGERFIPKLEEVLRRRVAEVRVSSNFRKGDDDAWRSGVPAEFHELMWDAIDPQAKELLKLTR